MKHIGLLFGLILVLILFSSGAFAAILFDGFENGGTLNPNWIMLPGYGANGAESTEKPYSGTYSMLLTASPQAGSMRIFDQNYYGQTVIFNAWFYHVAGGTDFGGLVIKDDKNVNIAFAYKWITETMLYGTGAGSGTTGSIANDAWYRFSISYNAATRKIDYNVYNTSLTLVASALNQDYYSGDGGNGYYPYRIAFITSDGGKSYADDVNWGTNTSYVQTFNVYQTGMSTNLSKVDMDCNVNAYDLNNQTSPFSLDMNIGTYSCGFLINNGYAGSFDRNTIEIAVTSVKTNVIYLTPTNWWNANWQYRQKLTLQTSKIGMSGNVTNDHVMLVDINSTNTNLWKNISYQAPGVILTESTGFTFGDDTLGINQWAGEVVQPTRNMKLLAITVPAGNTATECGILSYNGATVYLLANSHTGNDWNFSTPYTMVKDVNYIVACRNTSNNPWQYKLATGITRPVAGTYLSWKTSTFINAGVAGYTDNQGHGIKSIQVAALPIAGNDIRFVNAGNTATYNWHAEDLNTDTNRLLAWVGITDTFPSGTDLNLYVYYGNNSAASDQNSIATYPSTYVGVWHEGETAGTISNDAIARDNGTITNALINQPNKIDGGYFLDGDGDYITYANESNFDFLTNSSPTFSLIQWIKTSAGGSGADQMFSKYQFNGGTNLGLQTLLDSGKAQIKFWTDPSNYVLGTSNNYFNDNTWHHLVFTANGAPTTTTNVKFYGDGDINVLTYGTAGSYSGAANAYSLMWGKQGDYPNYFKGYNDELKIINYAISSDEVKLLYNSERDLNLIIFGSEDNNNPVTDPCIRTINTDWNISTQIDCNLKSIDLGTGKLIISSGGRLRLYDTNVITDQLKLSGSGNLLYIFSRSSVKIK